MWSMCNGEKIMKYIRTKDRIYEDKYVHIKVDKDGYAIMEYKGDFYDAPEKVKSCGCLRIEKATERIRRVNNEKHTHIN